MSPMSLREVNEYTNTLDDNDKLVFIRVNADHYTVDGKKKATAEVSLENRVIRMLDWLEALDWESLDEDLGYYLVYYLVYTVVQNGKKVLVSAKEEFDEEALNHIIHVGSS